MAVPTCLRLWLTVFPNPSGATARNALADIDVFVFAVEAELEAMNRERVACIAAAASQT